MLLLLLSPPQQHAKRVNKTAIRSEMVAASTSHVATPYEAGLPRTFPLMAFRTTPKRAKSRAMAARETRKARKTINEANRKPNCLDPRAMI